MLSKTYIKNKLLLAYFLNLIAGCADNLPDY
jgi:hypothetical protein